MSGQPVKQYRAFWYNDDQLEVHEVILGEDEETIIGVVEEPAYPTGVSVTQIKHDINRMRLTVKKELLKLDDYKHLFVDTGLVRRVTKKQKMKRERLV